jgi:N-formylglutamate amidohydrolase
MIEDIYRLRLPAEPLSGTVFNSPHSGREYPPSFLAGTLLDRFQIRSSEDAFVDLLFDCAPEFGAPLLAARVPRACVDLNRAPDELDPALIVGATRRTTNPRIAAGLGVIPRVVAEGRTIIAGKLPLAEAERRIAAFHRPYHARLLQLMEEQRARFGRAILYDCHSMPHDALASAPTVRGRRPEVILGDRFGAACARWVIEAVADAFRGAGFVVARNAPFAGGFITQHYGRPAAGWHALQIEIDRALYMDERRVVLAADFEAVRARLRAVVADLARLGGEELPLAAE